MLEWWKRLMGSRGNEPLAAPKEEPNVATGAELSLVPKKPSRKRRSQAEIRAAKTQELYRLKEWSFRRAQEDRERQVAIGVTQYVWRCVCDERSCSTCRANDGKTFGWDARPPSGHPGECQGCSEGYCRSWAEAVLPGVDELNEFVRH